MRVTLLAITPGAERVIEDAGRTCYLSFDKMGEGSAARLIGTLVKSGHHSVLEHASATFRVEGLSRSATHQLIRHRLASYSQQSQRYVDETGFTYVEPPSIAGNPEARDTFLEAMEACRRAYAALRRAGIPKEDARYVLPNATCSTIVITANFREFRHIFELRGGPRAQWEIRELAIEMLSKLKAHAPSAFADLEIDLVKRLIVRR